MSHTNQTPNYHLPQFIGTDKPAWLVDVNQAYADIDTQMKANETASATAEADAQSALAGVTSQASQLSALQTSVTALETARPLDEAQIETNRQNIATNAQNIVDLDNRMGHTPITGIGDGTATGAIADLQGQINNIPTVSDMTGATASTAGTHGLVPAPSAGDENKYLKGDGTWGTVGNSGEYVEVTADGVKNAGVLFDELYALIDTSKLKPNSVLTRGDVVYQCTSNAASDLLFATISVSAGTNMVVQLVNIKSSGSKVYGATNATTYTDTTSTTIPASGSKIRLMY